MDEGDHVSGRFPQERRDYIEKKLLTEGKIRVSELASFFDVSSETIRKDLLYLESKGIAKKGYGGAVVANELLEPSFIEKSITYQSEKEKIAQVAADQVDDGMIVLMDAGSTVYAIAKLLSFKKDITVFTNGLKAAQTLDDFKVRTFLLGGEVRNNSNAIVGGWALRALSEIKADLAIVGTSGFVGRSGPCVENFPEADIKKAMIKSANRVVVVGDGSKANSSAMIQFCNWEDVDAYITDASLPEDVQKDLEGKIEVLIAK